MVKLMKYADVKGKLLNSAAAHKAHEEAVDEIRAIQLMAEIRKVGKVTQDEVAAKMGTQKSNISRLENGKTDPRLSTLFSYARALGLEIELSIKLR